MKKSIQDYINTAGAKEGVLKLLTRMLTIIVFCSDFNFRDHFGQLFFQRSHGLLM